MTLHTPPFWGPDYDLQFESVVREYTFLDNLTMVAGTLTSTGSGAATVVDFTNAHGAALSLSVGAHPGTALMTGIPVQGGVARAVGIEVFGLDFTGTGRPVLTIGLEDGPGTRLAELYRDDSGFKLLGRNGGASPQAVTLADGNDYGLTGADLGLLADWDNNIIIGHAGSSMGSISGVTPTGSNMSLIARCVTTAASQYQSYGVYIRKLRITLYRG